MLVRLLPRACSRRRPCHHPQRQRQETRWPASGPMAVTGDRQPPPPAAGAPAPRHPRPVPASRPADAAKDLRAHGHRGVLR